MASNGDGALRWLIRPTARAVAPPARRAHRRNLGAVIRGPASQIACAGTAIIFCVPSLCMMAIWMPAICISSPPALTRIGAPE